MRVVCFDLEVEGPAAIGSSRGTVVKGRTGPPLRKCARIFLTRAPGSFDVDVRGLGRVLEDGNVTWEYSQKLRERTGNPRRRFGEAHSPEISVISAENIVIFGQCSRTPMLPKRKFGGNSSGGGTGYLAGKSRGNLPVILVFMAWNSVSFVRCCKTQISPAKVRGKFVKGNWLPRWEVS